MGKWTPAYHDDVLLFKIKKLVTGAIKRSALDRDNRASECTDTRVRSPTYSAFVRELDIGDSFTTTLIEALVLEITDRCSRPTKDRSLVNEKTAQMLDRLTVNQRVYRGRASRITSMSRIRAQDYLSIPPEENEVLGDDSDDDPLNVELGAFHDIGRDTLFDAYRPSFGLTVNRSNLPWFNSSAAEPHSPWRADGTASRMIARQEDSTATASTAAPVASSSGRLNSSSRRARRSHIVDFIDFSSQRRSARREIQHDIHDATDMSSAMIVPPRSRRGQDPPSNSEGLTSLSSATRARMAALEDVTRSVSSPWPDLGGIDEFETLQDQGELEGPSSREMSQEPPPFLPIPRLRRGGVRPPEALFEQQLPTSPSRPTHLELPPPPGDTSHEGAFDR